MKKEKRKIISKISLFLILVITINTLLNFLLIQPGLARTVFHNAKSGKYNSIVLGASHGSYGIVPEVMDDGLGYNTMNMCMGGEYMRDSYYVLKYALKYNKVCNVVLDIDYQYLVNYHKESILHNSIYNAYPMCFNKLGYYTAKIMCEDYRGTFLKWTNYWQCYYMIPKTVDKKLSEAYRNYDPSVVSMNPYDTYIEEGFINRSSDFKKEKTGAIKWDINKVSKSEVEYIKKIVKLCRNKNISITFTTIPVDPSTIEADVNNYRDAHKYIQELADSLNVEYLDFNFINEDIYKTDTLDYWDKEGHMYGEAAIRFSKIYGQLIRKSLDGNLDMEYTFNV